MNVKYPEIEVQLTGTDGNAYAILGAVQKAMKDAGIDRAVISDYLEEATSGDYNHLLVVSMEWVEVF